MHILAIPSFLPPLGGAFCFDQARALALHGGHRVGVIGINQIGITQQPRLYFTAPSGFDTGSDGTISIVSGWLRGIPHATQFNMLRWVMKVRRAYDEYVRLHGRPDLLHAHCCKWAGYAAMVIARENGIPYVITEHLPLDILITEIHPPYAERWQTQLMREAYRHAALVIPVARELVDDIAPIAGRDYCFEPLSNVIDTEFYLPRQREAARPYRFCCLAINDPRKGYDVLYRAFASVVERYPDAELHIAGQGTQQLPEATGVHRHGPLDRTGVLDLLYRCHCLVLASRSEAQPLVFLEAMATGIPVIGTKVMPRQLRLEGVAEVVATGDAEALAAAMLRRIATPAPDSSVPSSFVRKIASPEVFAQAFTSLVTQKIEAARQTAAFDL